MNRLLTLHHLTLSCAHWMDKLAVTGESGMSGFGAKQWSQTGAEDVPGMFCVLLQEEGSMILY